jgi:hypothetical protein
MSVLELGIEQYSLLAGEKGQKAQENHMAK